MTLPFRAIRGAGTPLGAIADSLGVDCHANSSVVVRGIRQDSREVLPGEVFLARQGRSTDGFAHVSQAIARGARAVIAERRPSTALPVPVLVVEDARAALAKASAVLYGDPSRHMNVVGVTGTNGKTTTVQLLRAVLTAAGRRPMVLGTLGAQFGDQSFALRHNTPEADELTRLMAWGLEAGATDLIMEATSHAIAEKRVESVRFRVAVFTNLTHDHLDLHGSFDAYRRAKARLFEDLHPAASVIDVDDPLGLELARSAPAPVWRVSRRSNPTADVSPVSPAEHARRIRCEVRTPAGTVLLRSPLFGEHNVANVLAALSTAMELGVNAQDATASLAGVAAPPGRMQRCGSFEDGVLVFVDYAHTPDALEKALVASRAWTEGRVICVFGCGGDRDPTKRAPMGRIAGRLAERVIVTNDNPRGERPEEIAREIGRGLDAEAACWEVVLDRAAAICLAVQSAAEGDVVLIAGKGHERTQEIEGRRVAFDDFVVARSALKR